MIAPISTTGRSARDAIPPRDRLRPRALARFTASCAVRLTSLHRSSLLLGAGLSGGKSSSSKSFPRLLIPLPPFHLNHGTNAIFMPVFFIQDGSLDQTVQNLYISANARNMRGEIQLGALQLILTDFSTNHPMRCISIVERIEWRPGHEAMPSIVSLINWSTTALRSSVSSNFFNCLSALVPFFSMTWIYSSSFLDPSSSTTSSTNSSNS